jgi:hypothetical protein
MSKRKKAYTNAEARRASAEELLEALTAIFFDTYGRSPNHDEQLTLSETVAAIRQPGEIYTWSMAESGLREQTWDLTRGVRGLLS